LLPVKDELGWDVFLNKNYLKYIAVANDAVAARVFAMSVPQQKPPPSTRSCKLKIPQLLYTESRAFSACRVPASGEVLRGFCYNGLCR
jgi:hypothetical protein